MSFSSDSRPVLDGMLEDANDPKRRGDFDAVPPTLPKTPEEGLRWLDALCADFERVIDHDPQRLREIEPEGEFLI